MSEKFVAFGSKASDVTAAFGPFDTHKAAEAWASENLATFSIVNLVAVVSS